MRDTPDTPRYCARYTLCASVLRMALEILTTRAVADRFGVAVSTVTRWVESGQLKPFTKTPGLRGAFLFDAAEVDRFAREREAA